MDEGTGVAPEPVVGWSLLTGVSVGDEPVPVLAAVDDGSGEDVSPGTGVKVETAVD